MTTEIPRDRSSFAWTELPENCHACLIYDDPSQRDVVVRAYLEGGLRRGELVRYFTDETPVDEVCSWLADAPGGPIEPSDDGPFRIARAEDAYCPGGRFEPPAVIRNMVPGYERARMAGFTGVRNAGEMSWALRGIPGSDRLIEYEVLLNTLPDVFPHSGVCQYDARRFDGATLFRVLRVHPFVVADSQVVWNPYYVTPETVLAEMGLPS